MRISRKAILWLILIPLLSVAALNLWHLWRQTTNPGDTNNPESLAVYWILKVSHGQALYTDFRKAPYNLTSYGPVYYFTVGALTRWFHLDTDSVFVWGRRFILLCTLLITALIYGKTRREADDAPLGLLAASFFLSCYILFPIATTCRPDMLAALFSLSGVLLYGSKPSGNFRFFSILFFVAAYFTKQSFISAPVSVILYEFLRDKKRAALFAVIYAGCVGGILLWMHLATAGITTINMIVSNLGPMRLFNVRVITNTFLQMSPLTVMLAVVALSAGALSRLEGIYFLISLAVAIITSAKTGSAVNYFVEPLMAASLLAPAALNSLLQPSEANGNASRSQVLNAFVISAFWVLLLPQFNFLLHTLRTLRYPAETEIRGLVGQSQGHVLSDSPRVAFLAKDPIFMDALNLSFMEQQGRWSSDGLVNMLEHREIQYVVLTLPVEQSSTWEGFHRFPQKVLQKIQSDYRLWRLIDNYYVYVPRS